MPEVVVVVSDVKDRAVVSIASSMTKRVATVKKMKHRQAKVIATLHEMIEQGCSVKQLQSSTIHAHYG